MKNSELIYNTFKNIINTSSDICSFNYPDYDVSGIDSTILGLTSASSNVFIIEDDIEIPIDISFTTNLSYLNSDVNFNFQILPLDKEAQIFTTNGIYTSEVNVFDDSSTGVTYDNIVSTANLKGEGEYIMKLSYQYKACTEIAAALGKRYVATTYNKTLPFAHFDDNHDKYFVVLYKADEPLLDVGVTSPTNTGTTTESVNRLKINALVVKEGVSDYIMNVTTDGDLMVTLNGLVLTKDEDYTLSGGNIQFAEPLRGSDLVNYIFIGKDNTSGLKSEYINIDKVIQSGTTGEQGLNQVYFNTDSNKYEVYTQYRVKSPDSLVLTLRGVLLTNQIDYYVSSSDSKRIILQGDVYINDWMNIIYDSGENLDRAVTEPYIDISWYVNKQIDSTNGVFEVEFSKVDTFSVIEQSELVPYVIGKTSYVKRVDMNYPYGTVLYYRIKNTKNYSTISGDILNSDNVSDSIRIEIKTNISNNY